MSPRWFKVRLNRTGSVRSADIPQISLRFVPVHTLAIIERYEP
nr:MAG TPA: hypothetical protein [Caudoviricetes sp.]